MSTRQSVVRKAIPLCGIVLVLGTVSCGNVGLGIDFPVRVRGQNAQQSAADQQELISTVQRFLQEAPANRRETYNRFFADDVIYTRNTGQVVTKKDIVADTSNPVAPRANVTFTGEEFTVHPYGDMAVVNFRLVMHGTENGNPVTRSFRNTGTFMKRNGQWQAVAWQATQIAEK